MKKSRKGPPVSLMIGLVILLVIGGGVYFFHKKSNKNEPRSQVGLSQSICNSLVQETPDKMEDSSDGQMASGTCRILIGKDTSYVFSFEDMSKVTDKEQNFVLNIYTPESVLMQTIPIAYSTYSDINLHDDINFDGYKDLLVRVQSPRASQFTYYIYNPSKKIFEADDNLSNIFTPTFDSKDKLITCIPDIPNYYTDENGDQQYYSAAEQTSVYKFQDGKYSLVSH